jgi:alpha-tubulin suppressor-like RCC1 family protein
MLVQVATGSEHCLVLSDRGSVYSWGWNEHGQLGTPETSAHVVASLHQVSGVEDVRLIGCGYGHCFAVTRSVR